MKIKDIQEETTTSGAITHATSFDRYVGPGYKKRKKKRNPTKKHLYKRVSNK